MSELRNSRAGDAGNRAGDAGEMSIEVKSEFARVRAFASDLRRLRLAQGQPTYEALARRTALARSTIADAFAGRRLPSERTLFAIVDALGQNPEEWLARRAEIVAEESASRDLSGTPESGSIPPPPTAPPVPGQARSTWWARAKARLAPMTRVLPRPRGRVRAPLAMLLLITTIGTGALLGARAWPSLPTASGATSAAGTASAMTGNYPSLTDCHDMAELVQSADGRLNTEIEIWRSAACGTVWARVSRAGDVAAGSGLRIRLAPSSGAQTTGRSEAIGMDTRVLYSPVITPADAADTFCAQAWITDGITEVAAGEPVCG